MDLGATNQTGAVQRFHCRFTEFFGDFETFSHVLVSVQPGQIPLDVLSGVMVEWRGDLDEVEIFSSDGQFPRTILHCHGESGVKKPIMQEITESQYECMKPFLYDMTSESFSQLKAKGVLTQEA